MDTKRQVNFFAFATKNKLSSSHVQRSAPDSRGDKPALLSERERALAVQAKIHQKPETALPRHRIEATADAIVKTRISSSSWRDLEHGSGFPNPANTKSKKAHGPSMVERNLIYIYMSIWGTSLFLWTENRSM